ncbi:Glutathione S-transferase A5 [Manis javanica]|nr:Glutathione S-transferase A5 [Manis javanica]
MSTCHYSNVRFSWSSVRNQFKVTSVLKHIGSTRDLETIRGDCSFCSSSGRNNKPHVVWHIFCLAQEEDTNVLVRVGDPVVFSSATLGEFPEDQPFLNAQCLTELQA